MRFSISLILCLSAFAFAGEDPALPRVLPGQRTDGSVLLPNQWSLRPAGRQVELGDFPVNIAVHPKGKYAAILHCGYSKHEIVVVDVKSAKIVSRTAIDEAFFGIVFSRDGDRLYCSGGSYEGVRAFTFTDGELKDAELIPLRDAEEKGIPSGMAISGDSKHLFVANVWGQSISGVDLENKKSVFELRLSAAAPMIVTPSAQPLDPDIAAVTKRAEAMKVKLLASEPFPYSCALDEKNERLFVSLWAQASVAIVDLKTHTVVSTLKTEDHPNEMLLTKSGKTLYVANANRNTVSVIDTESGAARETLYAALYPNLPLGTTPMGLALTPDEKLLFVANANINALTVFDVSKTGKSRSLGFIPAGWYPTSVRVTPDGKKLLVANGKGGSSKSNPSNPESKDKRKFPYIGGLLTGTLSIIDLPKREKFEEQLKQYSAQVFQCSPIRSDSGVTAKRPKNSPIPLKPGDSSPIKYCIYVIKENRTYDQVLGDMKEGNGDPSLCIFPEKVTPNQHKLAREFVLLDNLYVDGEVSADGHEWSMGAYATDFIEKSWPMGYGHNRSRKYLHPSEGRFQIAFPTHGYLWDRAKEAGVSYRSYGEFTDNGPTINDPCTARLPALVNHIDPYYRTWDMDYPDCKRVERFKSELKRFETEGGMPRLQIVLLPADHTVGTSLGKPTPAAFVAENDLALGKLVEAVSQSKFWPETAIFVIEDDAQDGPDHVDAHRSIGFVISPYTRRAIVDSTMYSTCSMLRTMELILGLQPLSQFDAAATPMYAAFSSTADIRPYMSVPAQVDLEETNKKSAWGGNLSEEMDFSKEDVADARLLNEIIWRSVRGEDSAMPAPIRAAFVFLAEHGDDGDDK